MVNLTFGEQVKIILSRKGMTIKELAEKVQERTGKNMSRQNMTQRLGRDNFQEQDMRLIADILGCTFQLSIMEMSEDLADTATVTEAAVSAQSTEAVSTEAQSTGMVASEEVLPPTEREITVGELVGDESQKKKQAFNGIRGYVRKPNLKKETSQAQKPVAVKEEILGERNPYTGKEYQTNSVRMHPKRIGYVQVYDQQKHAWTDMTEWAFLGYQERKKRLLGKNYVPPIYLD